MEIKINYGKYEGSRNEIESSTSNNLNNIEIFKIFYGNNKLKVDNKIKRSISGHNIFTGGTTSFSIADIQDIEFKTLTFYIESINESSCTLFFESMS